MHKIGIIIGGASGYMGQKGVGALESLEKELRNIDVEIDFVFLVDPNPIIEEILVECFPNLRLNAAIKIFNSMLSEALASVEDFRRDEIYPVLVYDASPTTAHIDNLAFITERSDSSILYLGEKPIFTDLSEIKFYEHEIEHGREFFCELIETVNPVFTAINNYLETEILHPSINRISLWRAGCSGLKKAVTVGRDGVEGGALEDKSLHDLSITVGILGVQNIKRTSVTSAKVHSLIPHSKYYEDGSVSFLTIGNRETTSIETDLRGELECPADGLFSMDVEWEVASRTVCSNYLFSWLGVNESPIESEFAERLSSLGFPPFVEEDTGNALMPRRWLDIANPTVETFAGKNFELRMDEARVGVIEFERNGERNYIVCNFLAKYNIRRFAYVVREIEGKAELVYTIYIDPPISDTYAKRKSEDLSVIFMKVLKQGLGLEEATLINSRSSMLVHDVMIRARKKAYRELDTDPSVWFKCLVDLCAGHIRPK